jgi:subtilisin family serine protease
MTTNDPDQQYSAGTVEDGARLIRLFPRDFGGAGKKSGHGAVAWLPAPPGEMPLVPWQPQRPPVIALLDSGVQDHDWLPTGGDPQFVVNATEFGWAAPALDQPAPPPGLDPGNQFYGSHYGHATFIAGLIRLAAPDARVLSMQIMNNAGKVGHEHVVHALEWLAGHPETGVDIVLMAFGRQADPGDADLDDIRTAIGGLSGARIVCSAGNDDSDRTVYPAAFAAEGSLPVVSVGAFASPTERAPYSNYGPWVQEWRRGTSLVSIMPLTTSGIGESQVTDRATAGLFDADKGNGYAWWSGTSFAAALYAAELANQMSAG